MTYKLQNAHEFHIDQLVLMAQNWNGDSVNGTIRGLVKPWKKTQGDPKQGWDILRAMRYVLDHQVNPCCKADAKQQGKKWTLLHPLGIRQEAALEIVGQICDEFELGNFPEEN